LAVPCSNTSLDKTRGDFNQASTFLQQLFARRGPSAAVPATFAIGACSGEAVGHVESDVRLKVLGDEVVRVAERFLGQLLSLASVNQILDDFTSRRVLTVVQATAIGRVLRDCIS
jgi:hypothetical protein